MKKIQSQASSFVADLVTFSVEAIRPDKIVDAEHTGGRLGKKNISKKAKLPVSLSNYVLASYGAVTKSVVSGHKSAENVIQSFLTGDPRGPAVYPSADLDKLTKTELEIFEKAEGALVEMNSLTKLAPPPVPISEFCLRPENFELKGLCK